MSGPRRGTRNNLNNNNARTPYQDATRTDWMLTINSNQHYFNITDELRDELYLNVENFLFQDMFKEGNTTPDGHVWAKPGDDHFEEIFGPEVTMAGAEFIQYTDEGAHSKSHKLHWHITFRVYSYVPTYKQGAFRERIQRFLDTNYPLPEIKYIKKAEYAQGIREKRVGKWYVNLSGSWVAGRTGNRSEMSAINYTNKVPRAKKMLEVYEQYPEEFEENNQNVSVKDGRNLLGESLNWACKVLGRPLLFPELQE